jgi:hypothetical protein
MAEGRTVAKGARIPPNKAENFLDCSSQHTDYHTTVPVHIVRSVTPDVLSRPALFGNGVTGLLATVYGAG